MVEKINAHISEFLDYYLTLTEPGYAVLIDGNWGSGKTYFIKEFIKSRIEKYKKVNDFKKKENPFLYISLNGLSNYKEIDEKIFCAIHPFLSSKPVSFLSGVASAAFRIGTRVDFANGISGMFQSGSPSISVKELFKNIKNKVLIFDDLERCNINHAELLGYINLFVEHQKLKVICIANEKELDRSTKIETFDSGAIEKISTYSLIKEKIFGKIIRIIPRFEEIFEIIVKEFEAIRQDFPKTFILINKETLIKIFYDSKSGNIRVFKLILLDWHLFWNLLDEEVKGKELLLKNLMKFFFIFSFEVRLGSVTPIQLAKLINLAAESLVKSTDPKSTKKDSNPLLE
ncbi:MAG: KAP family NTPase, partial [Leptospira sp.]|nr:KAP family NTPase [Leptospira sp.]